MPPENDTKKSKYTAERGWPGAFEGETVSRRGFITGTALGAGGVASAMFGLPALGFALGPIFEKTEHRALLDVGAESDFNEKTYVPTIITVTSGIGEAGKTLLYIRKKTADDGKYQYPYVAISTRCAHLGCPVRYIDAAKSFICPCHGGTYDFQGQVTGGPPVRPLDRFETAVKDGRVYVGERFSVNSKLKKVATRDPGAHVDGLWQYIYPPRPTT